LEASEPETPELEIPEFETLESLRWPGARPAESRLGRTSEESAPEPGRAGSGNGGGGALASPATRGAVGEALPAESDPRAIGAAPVAFVGAGALAGATGFDAAAGAGPDLPAEALPAVDLPVVETSPEGLSGPDLPAEESRGDASGLTGVESPAALGAGRFQPGGGTTCTKLPHFGQSRISPIADSSWTLSRAWHVVHWIAKSSTRGCSWEAMGLGKQWVPGSPERLISADYVRETNHKQPISTAASDPSNGAEESDDARDARPGAPLAARRRRRYFFLPAGASFASSGGNV